MPKKPKRWSYSVGERGRNRVRVFENRLGVLYVEYYEHTNEGCKPCRVSMGHRDRHKAKQKADQIAAQITTGAKPETNPTPSMLFDNYRVEVSPRKGAHKQSHDAKTSAMMLRLFGHQRKALSLNATDWHRYIQLRRDGLLPGYKSVRNQTIRADLQFVLAVFNWAVKSQIVSYNPLRGLKLPAEKNPIRTVFTDDEYRSLLRVAPRVDRRFELAVIMAHETGHRIAAIRHLKRSDVDLEAGTILWRAEQDKSGREHTTPLTQRAITALRRTLKAHPSIGDTWLMPTTRDASKNISQRALQMWMTDAIDRAAIRKRRNLGFHSFRRKFATELRWAPIKDLMALGGWQDPNTIIRCYQQPDMGEMRKALEKRSQPTHQSTHHRRKACER